MLKIFLLIVTQFNLNLTQQEASSDITLTGVEMVAGAYDYEIDLPPVVFQCHQDWQWGRCNICWVNSTINAGCQFTGLRHNVCCR